MRWFVRGTGPSGASGFACTHKRLEQEEFDFNHGDYFGIDHMEDRWIPFLNKPLEEIPRSDVGGRIPRPHTTAPWGLYGLGLTAFLMAIILGGLLWSRGERHLPPPPPPSVLAGYVTDAEARAPLAGVTLTIQDWDTLDGRSPTCTTGDDGRFRFKNLRPSDDPAQQVRLIASKPDYEPSESDPPLGEIDYPIKLRPKAILEDKP